MRIIRAGALAGSLRAAAMLAMLVFVSCMSSWMTSADFGLLALIISLATLAAGLGSFGQAEMAIRSIAARRASGDDTGLVEVPNEIAGLVVWISGLIGCVLALYLVIEGYSAAIWISTIVLSVALSLMTALSGAARAADRFVLALFPKDIAWRVLAIAFVGAGVFLGRNTEAGVVVPIVALSAVACAVLQLRGLGVRTGSLFGPPSHILNRPYLTGSATIAISIFAVVALGTLDVIIVGALISPDAAAAYFPANRLAIIAVFTSLPIQMVVEPRLASMLATEDAHGAQQVANAATGLQFLMSLVLGLAVVGGFPVYDALFPTASQETFQVLVILVAGVVLGSMLGLSGSILLMSGNQALFARTNILCAGLAAGLLLLAAGEESLTAIAFVVAGIELLRKSILAIHAYRRTALLPFTFRSL